MDERPFIVASEKAFKALPHWLKERGCNTYSYHNRKGFAVGYDSRPDSDWGKYERRGYIRVCNPEMFDATEDAIAAAFRKIGAYGWTE